MQPVNMLVILTNVLTNIALMVALSYAISLSRQVWAQRPRWFLQTVEAAAFGVAAAATMILAPSIISSIQIDGRILYIAFAAMILPARVSWITPALLMLARLNVMTQDRTLVTAAFLITLTAWGYGAGLRLIFRARPARAYRSRTILLIGLGNGIIGILFYWALLPSGIIRTLNEEETALAVLMVLLAAPLLQWLIWRFYTHEEERLYALDQMRHVSKRLHEIINAMPFAVLISRVKDRRIVFTNQALVRMMQPENGTGYDEDTLNYYADPEDRKRMIEILHRDGVVQNFIMRSKRPDGSLGWVSLSARPIEYEGEPALLAAYLDVTPTKEMEEALRLSQARYEAAIEASGSSVWEWLPDSNQIIVSPNLPALLGLEADGIELTLDGWRGIVWQEDWTLFYEALRSMLEAPARPREIEYRLRCADGQPRWMLFRGRVLLPEERHAVRRVLGIHTDITEIKRFQELLHRRDVVLQSVSISAEWFLKQDDFKAHIAEMLALMGEGVGADRSYIFEVLINETGVPVWRQRYEWCAPEIEPQIDNAALQNIPYLELAPVWSEMLANGRPVTGHTDEVEEAERRLLEPQGIQSIMLVPIHVSGRWWGFIGFDMCRARREWELAEIEALQIAADLLGAALERRQVQRALQESEARFRLIAENSSDLICLHALDGRILYANPATRQALGYTPEEVEGTYPADYVHPDDLATVRDQLMHPLSRQSVRSAGPVTYRFQHKSGEYRWFETFAQLVYDAEGQPFQMVSSSRDVSERIETEQRAMQIALEEEKIGLLRQFIADASHDFRTPLSSINTSLYLLRRAWEDQERRERYMNNIAAQTARMDRLLENLLMMVRLDSATGLRVASMQVADSLRRVLIRVQEHAHNKKIDLLVNIQPGLSLIEGDPEVIDNALWHVVENAIHYTPEGGTVQLRLRVDERRSIVEVEDNGIGIHEVDQPFIFNRFYRVDQSRSTETGGSGLGLSIAQKAMELHGGRIEFESAPGKGSLFRLILPLRGVQLE